MASRSSSASCCSLLVLGLLLLSSQLQLLPPAVAAPDWNRICPCVCGCMEVCSDGGNSLDICAIGCIPSCPFFTSKQSKEVAVSWPNSIAWGKFCPCMCSCMVDCSGKGNSLKSCGPVCAMGCNNTQNKQQVAPTTSWANSTA